MRDSTAAAVERFLTSEVFHTVGVPEILHSDIGKQFVGKKFADMIQLAYLDQDHRDWDLYLPEIETALRSSIHQATGSTPYFALFGQHIFTSGADYQLARKLHSLEDCQIRDLDHGDRLELLRESIRRNIHRAHESSARYYNRTTRQITFKPGQEIFRRNFVQSDFGKNFNAKFARKFVMCRIRRPVGNHMYEVEDMRGKLCGVYHVKELKQ
ncbi:uncharacterized protein LOC128263706 [Drosophila gunungcola]|uniref:uncharacterized protein LOC128263706 n=1 Tax=Drosophila gunungcola TaxID=103775 RepID=UPI0022E82678|nr:uncharacterized protein LOC128263706 [Drosophila gunungcola]